MRLSFPKTVFCMVLYLTFAASHAADLSAKSGSPDSEQLKNILPLLAEYCSRFAEASLHYICLEEIKETIYSPLRHGNYSFRGTRDNNSYIYDYQLIYKDGQYKENRILLEENGRETKEPDATLKVKRSSYEYLITGPVGLFSDFWQPFYDYRIIKTTKFKGKKVFVIDVRPKAGVKHKYLYGKAWIDAEDLSVQKIEYNQGSIINIENIQDSAEKIGLIPDITIVTEFAYEKNGIRFPSECSITEDYFRKNPAGRFSSLKYHKSKLRITYSDYQFFTVETQVDIKK